ncbi:MAG: DegT/DnrJ/EryC1/StrS family aminotransferase [Candidatus Latescibacterota bacterium]|nr:DegT/DnrJ/EryC1/StrS family aminotransferase [Candidatus Latescibacterota bacterium]
MHNTTGIQQIDFGNFTASARAKHYVNQVLDSDRLSYGEFSRRFEEEFAALHQVPHAICCNSGTSALQMALACLMETEGWKEGDEVLVPAITFVATSNMVMLCRLKPVFVDVDPRTYNIDPERIEEKITTRTRAIIPVHLFGLPCEMDPIMDIARRRGLRVIEDSAETMFARFRGKSVGSFGDIACFSTYVGHMLATGVGGLATTSDSKYAEILRSYANHGRDPMYTNIDDKGDTAAARSEIASHRYRFVRFGHSFRITEFESALGLAQLAEVDSIVERRQNNAARLTEGLAPFGDLIQLPHIPSDRDHVFMVYPIVIRDSALDRDELIAFLESCGIETREMMPLLSQPIYVERFGDILGQYPVAQNIEDNGFFIGCHPNLTHDDIDYVAETFTAFFSETKPSPRHARKQSDGAQRNVQGAIQKENV